MSIESLAVVLQHAPFTGRDKLILIALASHDGDGGSWPAIATLARYGNCSIASAKRSLQVLVEAKAVTKHVQRGGTGNMPDWAKPNLYEIHVECPPNCDKTRKHAPIDKHADCEPNCAKTRKHATVDNMPSMLWRTGVQLVNPGSGDEPRGGSGDEPRGGSGDEPLTIQELSNNENNESPFTSTSPADEGKCFACGKVRSLRGRFCVPCRSSGRDNPMLNCWKHNEGCTVVGRRAYPGQDYIKCRDHK